MNEEIKDDRVSGAGAGTGRATLLPGSGPRPVEGMGDDASPGTEEQRELLESAELVLIDLDGCLAFGNEQHPAAGAFLMRYDGRYAILSNNSSETPEGLARILAGNGLKVDPRRMLLAGSLTVDLLAAKHIERRIYLLASDAIRSYARASGLRLSPEIAEVVALARDTTLTYDKLDQAIASLYSGAELILSNPDMTHPGLDRLPVLETGAILQLFRACIPDLPFTVVGKPSRRMFDMALARYGGRAANTVMIGDNAETDGAGARGAGITPILVGPGQGHASIAELL